MPQTPKTEYDKQRERVAPPRAPIGAVRNALGLTLDQVRERMSEVLGKPYSRGALSALENGHRGASREVLDALEIALGLRSGDLHTEYAPSENTRRSRKADAA